MGRNSVEATKACRMRAVRARRDARLDRVTDRLRRAPARAVGFAFLALVAGAFSAVEGAGGGDDGSELCAGNGATAISKDSKPASHRRVGPGTGLGEMETLMVQL
jgi:hypothetical protein